MIKRLIDILVSTSMLIITSPLILLIALLVKLTSRGPVLFKADRIGLNGKPFIMHKFRSMRVGDEKDWIKRFDPDKVDDFVFQDEDNPRITKIGRFLRKTSVDELPNLVNVLMGQMSMVGPRPEEPEIVEHYSAGQRRRLTVKPGITGLAQISGRGELFVGEMVAKDLEYIDNYSLWLDIKILLVSPFHILTTRGAK
jgi:lipopolysaccharide/colanic/teichoic acid biosynthesis glycosyltransferase